ncbi:MAG: transporter [Flaviaesturariibacter sp.]|nr:transporter [Flaviaesturariibacter sp.]
MRAAKSPRYLLLVIVLSQVAGTSLWFAGNAVINEIQQQTGRHTSAAYLTSIIQIGFICGTAVFSYLAIADRYRSATVFALSSLLAALANLSLIWLAKDAFNLSALRFITGFFLAGIYPIGMKIAAEQFPEGLGNVMGFLVGALVLGTALPHGLRAIFETISWKWVIITTSLLALIGGALIYFLIPPDKSHKKWTKLERVGLGKIFRAADFRAVAIGYFGHMWELYAFWAFVPFIIQTHNQKQLATLPIPITAFLVIAFGSICCVIGGMLSNHFSSKSVAFVTLLISGACCLISPFAFTFSPSLFVVFLLIWSGAVITDSPQFSTLVAQTADLRWRGTALTLVTSVGFTITIVSIQVLQMLKARLGIYTFLLLAPGPLVGLLFFRSFRASNYSNNIGKC